jgi:hypothetical protein
VFEQPFPFCTKATYPLTPEEHRWCALMPKDDKRCPELAKACGLGATAKFEGTKEARERAHAPWKSPVSPLGIRILLWVLLAAGVGFLIYQIVRHAVAQGPIDRERPRDEPEAVVDHAAAAAARQIETDVERLLASARAAAAAGDFRRAIEDAYAALLRKLEGNGVVRVEPHQTNGDHVRDVGRKLPAMRPRMQQVVETVEGVQFGGEPPAEASYRSVLNGVTSLIAERMAGVVSAAARRRRAGRARHRVRQPRSRPVGPFAVGTRRRRRPAVALRLRRARAAGAADQAGRHGGGAGDPARRHRRTGRLGGDRRLGGAGRDADRRGRRPRAARVDRRQDRQRQGGARHDVEARRAAVHLPVDVGVGARQAPGPRGAGDRLPRVAASVPSRHQVILAASAAGEPDDVAPSALLVRGRSTYAFERSYDGGGGAIVLADDRLFTNASLLVGDNARLMVELVRTGGRRVELAGELTGLVSTSPLTSVQRGRLAPALLQLALLVLVFFVYKGAHFGRPVDPVVSRRRSFSEHARAIGLQYARGRAARHALAVYGGYALERMRERLRLSSGKGLGAVAEEVAARSGRPLGEVMRVLLEAKPVDAPVQGGAVAAGAPNDLATIREIATLLATTGGSGERTGPQTKA